ncbi:DUF6968 family protein [Nocardia asteroides]|uniref:DUF6968 family protein n=1 Tax=Nocardia asteroides TaxID=1824 RepID=UPI001E2F021C|nr:hypothetical protein [Nocardia asteroides]UGT54258.1 hypothetical protein LTT85_27000 [Nocardia asteroides]
MGEIVVASTVRDGEREFGIEISEPEQDAATRGWQCTYRVDGTRTRRVRGPDRLAALYAALVDVDSPAVFFGLVERPGEDGHRAPTMSRGPGSEMANARDFGPPLGARAVETAHGPVVVVLGRPRRDPNRPHTCLCPFRIADRTEAFGQGFDDVRAVLSAIRGVSAILGIPRDWPSPVELPPPRPTARPEPRGSRHVLPPHDERITRP